MDVIEEGRVAAERPRQRAMRLAGAGEPHSGPADVRHGEGRPKPGHPAREQTEPRDPRRLFALVEQQLQPEADAEQGAAGPGNLVQRPAEARLVEAAPGGCEVAHAGDHHARGAANRVRGVRELRDGAHRLERA